MRWIFIEIFWEQKLVFIYNLFQLSEDFLLLFYSFIIFNNCIFKAIISEVDLQNFRQI